MISVTSKTKQIQGKTINSIKGCSGYSTLNPFDIPFGQLTYNKNMAYFNQNDRVYCKTRNGSELIKDILNKVWGASNYVYNLSNNYFIYVDSNGRLISYDDTNKTSSTLTLGLAKKQHNFKMFGFDTLSSLYGCNITDGVYKISGTIPTYSAIASSPNVVDIEFSSISGRMFGVVGQTIYYTEIQQLDTDNVSNLETWNTATNFAKPSPDDGLGYQAVIEDGDAVYFFKDTGIICLPNAEESVLDWYFPKLKTKVGTKSGKTVKFVKYGSSTGFIYLGTDNTLRFISPRIERNAGILPSIYDDTSHVISLGFQHFMDNIRDSSKCNAVFYDNKYILNIPGSVSTEIDITLVIDCEKLLSRGGDEYSQPYWYFTNNLNFSEYVLRSNDNELYGFNISGYISKLFVKEKYIDEAPSRVKDNDGYIIDWKIVFGWINYGKENLLELIKLYVNWGTDTDSLIKMFVNSFAFGELIPQFDSGTEYDLYPNTGSGSYEGGNITNEYIASSENNEMTTPISIRAKGNYFNFGLSDDTKNQSTIIYGITPIFKISRQGKINKR